MVWLAVCGAQAKSSKSHKPTLQVESVGPAPNEDIVQIMPAHFKLGERTVRPGLATQALVPDGESVHHWSTLITTQVFRGEGLRDPEDFLRDVAAKWMRQCSKGSQGDLTRDAANGYAAAKLLLRCPRTPGGQPENTLYRVISGHDNLYVVQYASRRDLAGPALDNANGLLNLVVVCDRTTRDHSCPDLRAQGFVPR